MEKMPGGFQDIVKSGQDALSSGRSEPEPETPVIEAEWVRRYPARPLRGWLYWLGLVLKVAAVLALTWLFYVIPPETFPTPFQNWKNPVVIFFLVVFTGKTLLDTLFYDHYTPR